MEMIILDKNASEHYLQEKKVLWQIYFARFRKTYLIQYGVGIILLIIAFSPLNTSISKTEYINNVTHQSETTYHHDTVNFIGAMGIVYIIMVSISLIRLIRSRKDFMDEAGAHARKHFKQTNESTIIIRDESLIYESPVQKTELKWIVFSNYSQFGNHLLLNLDHDGRTTFAINKELLSVDSFQELLNFIRQKIRAKSDHY